MQLAGAFAEDMQPVADHDLAEVAEMRIEPGQSFVDGGVGIDADVLKKAAGFGAVHDLAGDQTGAARVEDLRGGIFLDEFTDHRHVVRQVGGGDGRRHVADGDCAQPSLGGRGFARIVDDEGIDHRQRAHREPGRAFARQRHGLAGEPFGGSVRAEMDERVHALPETEIEGQIGVGRGRVGVVIEGLAVGPSAAIGLQSQQHLARPEAAETEGPVDQ